MRVGVCVCVVITYSWQMAGGVARHLCSVAWCASHRTTCQETPDTPRWSGSRNTGQVLIRLWQWFSFCTAEHLPQYRGCCTSGRDIQSWKKQVSEKSTPWRAVPECSWRCSRGGQSRCCSPAHQKPGCDAADLWRATGWSTRDWSLRHRLPAADPWWGQRATGQRRNPHQHAWPPGSPLYTEGEEGGGSG